MRCSVNVTDDYFKPPPRKPSLTAQKLLLNLQKYKMRNEETEGGSERDGLKGKKTRKRDIQRDILPQSLLPLSIYSLRKALEGRSRRREPGHY